MHTTLSSSIVGFRGAAFLALTALLFASPVHAEPPQPIKGELLVGLRRGANPAGVVQLVQRSGGAVLREISAIGVLQLSLPLQSVEALTDAIERRADVSYVERNRALPPSAVPNDPDYPAQWHLPHIETPVAWDLSTGAGVVVAILDSGVDASHPDLGPKMVPGYDATGGHTTDDVTGHGTAVAGSATALGNNAIGIASPAWHSELMPVRVAESDGWATDASIADGLVWAVNHGARVMNLSFWYVSDSATIVSAARYAFERGGLVVAAAGNCGCRESTRDTPFILNVGSTNTRDELSSYSSTGDFVDLTAPGVGITTTVRGGGYRAASGTSHASPVVAGVAALLFSLDPTLGPGEVEAILESSAEDFGPPGWDPGYGHGRVNAGRALLAAGGGSLPPPPEPVDMTAPDAWIEAPTDGATVSGITHVLAVAQDDTGVASVEFYIDGGFAARDESAPFDFAWDTRQAAEGMHRLEVVALDEAGNEGLSPLVEVAVRNISDTTPPSVQIHSPEDGSRVRGRLRVKATASDDRVVARVELLIDAAVADSQSCGTASCTVSFRQKLARGRHQIAIRAYDASGNEATSPSVEVSR